MRMLMASGLVLALGSPAVAQDGDLDALVVKCRELEDNDQIRDFDSKVLCRGNRTYWELDSTESFGMETRYNVGAAVRMKGGRIGIDERRYRRDSDDSDGTCNIYREMMVNIPVVTVTVQSCDELEEIAEQGRGNYCQEVIEDTFGPGDLDAVATGRTVSSCNQGSQRQDDDDQDDGSTDDQNDPTDPSNFGAVVESTTVWQNQNSYFFGVKVKRITNTRAAIPSLGLRAGDVITRVNGQQVDSVQMLAIALRGHNVDPVVEVFRGGRFLELR